MELIYSDLCDFHSIPSLRNKKYVLTFINDFSKFCYVCLLHTKYGAVNYFKIYKKEIEIKIGSQFKRLRIDILIQLTLIQWVLYMKKPSDTHHNQMV